MFDKLFYLYQHLDTLWSTYYFPTISPGWSVFISTIWLSRLNTLLVRPPITLGWFVCKPTTRLPQINALIVLPAVFLGCFLPIPTSRRSAQRIIPHPNDFLFCFVSIPTHHHSRLNALRSSKCFDWLLSFLIACLLSISTARQSWLNALLVLWTSTENSAQRITHSLNRLARLICV